jgi:hypothetical protein
MKQITFRPEILNFLLLPASIEVHVPGKSQAQYSSISLEEFPS